MTTIDLPTPGALGRPTTRRVPIHAVTLRRLISAERVKLTTLRSTWITYAVAFAGMIGFGVLSSWAMTSQKPIPRDFNPVSQSLAGMDLAQLAIGVVAVLAITGEYATGMIRSTISAEPRRLPVLWSKLAVFSVMTLVTMLVAAFASFFVAQAVMGTHAPTLGAPHALRSVVGAALYLTVAGALAMGLGFLIRSTAGGIAATFGLLLVLPLLGSLLPASWQQHVLPYLPNNAGNALVGVHPGPGALSAWVGLAVMVLWAGVALAAGAWRLVRQDV